MQYTSEDIEIGMEYIGSDNTFVATIDDIENGIVISHITKYEFGIPPNKSYTDTLESVLDMLNTGQWLIKD